MYTRFARVAGGSSLYALSNNHVYARQNSAVIGDGALQPGRFDTNCSTSDADVIGTLAAFVEVVLAADPLNPQPDEMNAVDAALVVVASNCTDPGGASADCVGTTTPSDVA